MVSIHPDLPPHSDMDALLDLVASLKQAVNQNERLLDARDKELQYSRLKIQVLEERLRKLLVDKYGKPSEKLSDLQLNLLEAEPGVSNEEVQAESERDPIAPASEPSIQDTEPASEPKRKRGGRQSLPAHLARVDKIITCPAEQCTCSKCGEATAVIGYEESEVLDVKPAEYFVTVVKREKRACKSCEQHGVSVAPVEERIIAKSMVSDQIVINTIVAKYSDSLPLFRQSVMLKRDTGIDISRSTMDFWVMQVGQLLQPLARAMRGELLQGNYIQADETPVKVQTESVKGADHQAYLWQYGRPGSGVVFDFRMGREREGPKQFLGQFEGILQTDGYAAYDRVGGPKMVHAGCLAHARRKYIEAIKLDPKDHASTRIAALMDELFAIDAHARQQHMSMEERHALRNEQAPALLSRLRSAILDAQKNVLPKSAAGKAASYTLALWSKLTLFLKYPELELSNNVAENSMRPIAVGRKNWIHVGSPEAGPKIAAIISVVESCRRLGLPVRHYLADVLPGLANRSIRSLANLTPAAYKAARA